MDKVIDKVEEGSLRGFCSFAVVVVIGLSILGTSCKKEAAEGTQTNTVGHTNQQVFQVKGVVISVKPRENQVEIRHEAVTNYMPAMTMPFDVKDTNELAGLEPGSQVTFRLIVTDTEGWIDQIHKLAAATNSVAAAGGSNSLPANGLIRVARNVEPLDVGEPLPEYQFTNQFGEPFRTMDFRGQALAITFLFTRCPYPNFCPRMANNFAEVQQKLEALSNGPTNWHLLTVSFDPEFDKPEVLKSYAQVWHYDPAKWTYATGDLVEVTALGEQVGLAFWHDETGSISHNLRTVVVDATGRVQKIFTGNTWAPEEVVEEMVKAAGRK
jgi:protein SCO1/2